MLSKELDVPEIVGKSLKEGLSAAFSRAGIKEQKRIVFLNDTTATLLSGIVQIPPMKPSKTEELKTREKLKLGGGDVIGFILGTGANTAHIESAIPKINFNDNKRPQIVVSESGAWAYGRRGKLDLEFDASTSQPNQYTLEKAASGAYLGNLRLHILKRAVLDGLLSFDKKNALLEMEKLETRNLNAFLHNPLAFEGVLGSLFSQNEVDAISTLLHIESIITERAALLSASLLAGTVLHTGAGRDPLRPLRIAVEGTTYLRYHHIRESLDARLETLLCKIHAPHYIIAPVEQASLQGAAVAALSTMGAAVAALSTTGGQAGQAGRA